jgi:enoyl-CoA hydratase/carnithine racemase
MQSFKDIGVEFSEFVATVEIRRPPHNFFDVSLIQQLADAFEALDADPACRAIVLAAAGKSFCAGANFTDPSLAQTTITERLYQEAVRLFAATKPIVAAVHGPAIGGGLGLALVADFRVTCPDARFSANFTRLGFHPGFGLTFTLPNLLGFNRACLMLYTSRRFSGDEAFSIGLADHLVPRAEVRHAAQELAREIAAAAPLGVVATRATMRRGMVEQFRAATEHERGEQARLQATADFKEGVRAGLEKRPPKFTGR